MKYYILLFQTSPFSEPMKNTVWRLNPTGGYVAASGMQTWCYYSTGTSEVERIARDFNILLTYI
jgi:hypothetical protein